MILALLPLGAAISGSGDQMLQPLAIAIIAGASYSYRSSSWPCRCLSVSLFDDEASRSNSLLRMAHRLLLYYAAHAFLSLIFLLLRCFVLTLGKILPLIGTAIDQGCRHRARQQDCQEPGVGHDGRGQAL